MEFATAVAAVVTAVAAVVPAAVITAAVVVVHFELVSTIALKRQMHGSRHAFDASMQ